MRAYDRSSLKRTADQESVRDLVETQDLWRPSAGPAGVPGFWAEFAGAYEAAARSTTRGGQLQSLLRLTRCPRLGVLRVHTCGRESAQVEAWCGAPYCPACGHERAANAARSLRELWADTGRVLGVAIPMGSVGRFALPQATSVAAVRDAWSRVTRRVHTRTGLPRLHPLPRLVVHPGGITQFLRLPWAPRGDDVPTRLLTDEARVACRRIGLRDVRIAPMSVERAIERFVGVVSMEATCFQAGVTDDLERLSGLDWRASFPGDATREAALKACARRWVQLVKDRHRQSRRQLCLGGASALPPPQRPTPPALACPAHGRACQLTSLRVRDWSEDGAVIWEGAPDSLSPEPTRAQVGVFFDRIAPAPTRKAG